MNREPAYDAPVPPIADPKPANISCWTTTTMRSDTPTTTNSTWPSRCLRWSKDDTKPTHQGSHHLPGIPCHALAIFACLQIQAPHRQLQRLRHTASYKIWKADPSTTPGDPTALETQLDEKLQRMDPTQKPTDQWKHWHLRAEIAMTLAIERQWAHSDRNAERPKGPIPTSRPTAFPAPHRLEETIALRRLRRLHRRAAEQVSEHQQRKLEEQLDGNLLDAANRASTDGITKPSDGTPTPGRALDLISAGIKVEECKISRERSRNWGATFGSWTNEVWQEATPKFKQPSSAAGFDAEGMRTEWLPHWRPTNHDFEKLVKNWKD
ncbi:hypothetical protein N9199_01980 [bacterium]|nr:hypothetical protein [bacterium]